MLVEPIVMADAEVVLYRGVFPLPEHDRLFRSLLHDIAWQQHTVTVCGRRLPAPRLSAWYGDPGACYQYSGLLLHPLPWIAPLFQILTTARALADAPFNSVLANLYRNGQDSVGWHSDAEPELGRNPVIASISLGAVRRFVLQHKKQRSRVILALEPGNLLLMRGTTQHFWRHQLPKTKQPVGPRINLTFRTIQSAAVGEKKAQGLSKKRTQHERQNLE